MEIRVDSTYDALARACTAAGLDVIESTTQVANYKHAVVFRNGFAVGNICSTGSFGNASMAMSLHMNKMSVFTAVFAHMETEGGVL